MTTRAVLIGVNYIGTSNQLYGCINDTRRVQDLLMTVYNVPSSQITVLTDDQPAGSPLFPTRDNILAALNNLINSTQAGDVAVYHFSGHGMQEKARMGHVPEPDGDNVVIIPVDVLNKGYYDPSKEIADDEHWNLISRVPSGATLFAIIDACHSGTEMDLPYNLRVDGPDRFSLDRVDSRPDTQGMVIVLSGCKDNQTSLDSADSQGNPAGALTYNFCDYVVHNRGVKISYLQLLSNVRQHIVSQNPRVPNIQEPQMSFGRMGDANQAFTLIPNQLDSEIWKAVPFTPPQIVRRPSIPVGPAKIKLPITQRP
jgi:hypothetical protein